MKRQQPKRISELFGLSQAITLAVVIVATVIVGILLLGTPLPEVAQRITPVQVLPFLGIVLWLGEVLLFWSVADRFARGPHWIGASGMALAILVRLLTSVIMATLAGQAHAGAQVHDALIHLLGIPAGVLALYFAFALLLADGYASITDTTKKHGHATPEIRYKFKTPPKVSSTTPVVITRMAPQQSVPNTAVMPPPSFVPQPPAPTVNGTVTLPREVVLKSIPEIGAQLDALPRVRVSLAHLTPQLSRPSAWLTWHEVAKQNALALPPNEESTLGPRWIRIPVRYFVSQVPRELFDRPSPKPLSWMTLSEVEQEKSFSL